MSPCHRSQPLSLPLLDTHVCTQAQPCTPDPLFGAHREARPVWPHLGSVCQASPVMLPVAASGKVTQSWGQTGKA